MVLHVNQLNPDYTAIDLNDTFHLKDPKCLRLALVTFEKTVSVFGIHAVCISLCKDLSIIFCCEAYRGYSFIIIQSYIE